MILKQFKEKNMPTGFYVFSFDATDIKPYKLFEFVEDETILFDILTIWQEKGYTDVSLSLLIKRFKGRVFSQARGEINNTPYLMYFVNDRGLEKFGIFINFEDDDRLRLCKDWRQWKVETK